MLAGPTLIDRGERYCGDGCLLISAASVDEARLIADADPYQSGGARHYAVLPWLTSEGALFTGLRSPSVDPRGTAPDIQDEHHG